MRETPPPGHPRAVEQGCTCPIMDNHHGQGCYKTSEGFVVTLGCPLHAPEGER